MGVVYPRDPSNPRDEIARQDRVEVDGADEIHLPAKQVQEETEMIFCVKKFSPAGPHFQPVLPVRPVGKRQGSPVFSPDQGHQKTCVGQGGTDPDHPLVKVQIIGHCTKDPLFHPANMAKPPHIPQLPAHYRHFYRIFGPDNNNFGKNVLILPPANN